LAIESKLGVEDPPETLADGATTADVEAATADGTRGQAAGRESGFGVIVSLAVASFALPFPLDLLSDPNPTANLPFLSTTQGKTETSLVES